MSEYTTATGRFLIACDEPSVDRWLQEHMDLVKIAAIGRNGTDDTQQGASSEVFALLAIIADPKKATARHKELNRLGQQAAQTLAEAKRQATQTAQLEGAIAERETLLVAQETALRTAQQQHDAKIVAVQSRAESLEAASKAHKRSIAEARERTATELAELVRQGTTLESRIAEQHNALAKRESIVADRERKAKTREEKLNAAEQALSDRMARLKEIVA